MNTIRFLSLIISSKFHIKIDFSFLFFVPFGCTIFIDNSLDKHYVLGTELNTAWSTFFEGNPIESDGTSLSSGKQYYVHYTQFINSNEGAVYLSSNSNSTKLLLEDVFFNNISSNFNDGNCLFWK